MLPYTQAYLCAMEAVSIEGGFKGLIIFVFFLFIFIYIVPVIQGWLHAHHVFQVHVGLRASVQEKSVSKSQCVREYQNARMCKVSTAIQT